MRYGKTTGRSAVAVSIPFLIASLIILGACRPEMYDPAQDPPRNLIVPDTLQPGDSLLGLHVATIDFRRAFEDSVWVGTAAFEGEVAVSGRYGAHFDCRGVPEMCIPCFYADSSSTLRLPRLSSDERYAWFCFSNPEDVERALGAPPPDSERLATIVIDRYTYIFSFSDVYNEARFVRENP